MTPGSGPETDALSDASITAQAARAKELRLALAVIGFQRSFTRWRWLLDPLPLELMSQVETDQPLLSCQWPHGAADGSTLPGPPPFHTSVSVADALEVAADGLLLLPVGRALGDRLALVPRLLAS